MTGLKCNVIGTEDHFVYLLVTPKAQLSMLIMDRALAAVLTPK